ncbi:MAG: glycosyltransferase family 39 protein [Nakamurella sp.]
MAVLVVATGLRVWQINRLGVNSDEAVYAGQAAALAGDSTLLPYFPVFRAHPLLFQSILSIPYRVFGVSELTGRLVSAAFGVGCVVMIYFAGKELYGRKVGFLAAVVSALMPYLVVVSRQVILDGPMTFFAAAGLYCMARYGREQSTRWLCMAGAAMGLTVLAKETSIVLMASVFGFLALSAAMRVRLSQLLWALGVFAAIVAIYPLSVVWSGASSVGGNFVVWQLLRKANHDFWFYPSVVPPAIGLPVVVAAVTGLWFVRRSWGWQESLLVWWVAVPAVFFQIWAVKGYQYLLPIAPAMAILAARALVLILTSSGSWRIPVSRQVAFRLATAVTVGWLAITSIVTIRPDDGVTSFLAGTGGVPGGREAGTWVADNVPEGSELLALGPSMANIIQFYGHRKTYGISVSPNPLHRNPVYEPVLNPDLKIRHNDLQYVVWDSFSAERSPFFSATLDRYVKRYKGFPVHTEYATTTDSSGNPAQTPIIIIYEVRP